MSKKNQATPMRENSAPVARLYMSIELSLKKWKLGFSDGKASRPRQRTIPAGDWRRMEREIEKGEERFGLEAGAEVWSCYEAGREGFWVHRALEQREIRSHVVDSASIEVNGRKRRAKTDRIDAEKLVRQLVRFGSGERGVWSVVRVPSEEAEDGRQWHRELGVLKQERKRHRVRIQSLLFTQGIGLRVGMKFQKQLEQLRTWDGSRIGPGLKARLEREFHRLELVRAQIRELERQRRAMAQTGATPAMRKVQRLAQLRGIAIHSGWVSVMEFFGWREFQTRRQVGGALGLTGTPYQSGKVARDQGISHAGNKRMRTLAVEMAWSWTRFQPQSGLSQWYRQRFASGGGRMRKIGIVALARRLMIALWRYLEFGELPEGALLKV